MSPIEIQKYEALANGLCNITLNSPGEENFNRIVASYPTLTDIEKARLRICITVAQARLSIWILRDFPAIALQFYGTAMRRGFAKTHLVLALEDYVILNDERIAFLSEYDLEDTSDHNHSIQVSDLVFGLIEIRRIEFDVSIQVDFDKETNQLLPLLQTSKSIMKGFLGKDPSTEAYTTPIMAMIGAYLASNVTELHKMLFPSP